MQSPYVLWYGRDEPPAPPRLLRAGPVTALLAGCDLRTVRRNGLELVRRLYVAVRDHNWNTIPGQASDFQLDIADDRFRVGFQVSHRQGDIDFRWRGTITGAPDGTIIYEFDGVAGSDFRYNRIGFCLLHPYRETAGRPFHGQTPTGTTEGTLPLEIGPQRIENGTYLGLFPAVSRLAITMEQGVTARFDFEGDLFEMEDQRNWTDASFKTYCTPLALPWPRPIQAGQAIRQAVTVVASGGSPAAEPTTRQDATIRVRLGEPLGRTLPLLGMASHDRPLSPHESGLLRRLRLDHLRVDLRLQDANAPRTFQQAVEACSALGCKLELALFVSDAAEDELNALAAFLQPLVVRHPKGGERPLPPLARVLVFHVNEESTSERWLRLARERLGALTAGAPLIGGTNAYFCEINRTRPPIAAMDGVAYSLNPQVHAFDDASLVETLEAQAETVRSTRSFCGDRPVIVSPVTLKPRFNANATGPEAPAPGQLPSPVDARQMSLFGAAWTLGSVKYLAESGAASVTYYETTGWRGVMEVEAGSPLPDLFPSEPGQVFPLYHVFADLAEWKSGRFVSCESSDPLAVVGLAMQVNEGLYLLLANLTPRSQRVRIGPLDAETVGLRRLNADTATTAGLDPERFRASGEAVPITAGQWELELAPYETARVDARGL